MACEFLYEGAWYTEDELRNVFAQTKEDKTTQPSKASKDTIKKMKEFLDRIGVDVETVGKIQFNGNTLGINGIAIPLQSLIQVVEGKEDVALTEEAMHMAVELLEQRNPKLFKEMMDRIGRYDIYDKVAAEYQNNPFYQKDGKPNVLKIKKETIGKVLAQTVINKNENANEKPQMLAQTRDWWQKIIDFLKDLFLRAGFNPFESAATQVLNKRDMGKLKRKVKYYQGYNGGVDGRKFNYFTLFEIEAKAYGGNVRDVYIDTSKFLSNKDKNYKDLLSTYTSTGRQFELYDNSKEGLERQTEFFLFIESKGYSGLLFNFDSDSPNAFKYGDQYAVSFTNSVIQSPTDSIFASRNPNAVNASMKLVASLRDPRATKWFDSLYKKGQKDVFFTKLQQDLQAPRGQVDLLKKWIQSNDPQSINDIVTGVLAELSYTVEVNEAKESSAQRHADAGVSLFERNGKYFIYDPSEDSTEETTKENYDNWKRDLETQGAFTSHYKGLNVSGGTNYRENEIKTPDITPSIKGHAAFATDKGIGWFRSDDMVKGAQLIDIEGAGFTEKDLPPELYEGGAPTKTRRILEVQSDLFQKGRSERDIVEIKPGEDIRIGSDVYNMGVDSESQDIKYFKNGKLISLGEFEGATEQRSENEFLQLLNKENNWVTFFVKAIIQDSAKKGYEKVRFPGGSTANKIEGQTTIEEFIESKEKSIDQMRGQIAELDKGLKFESFSTPGGIVYFIKEGKYYTAFGDPEPIEITKEDYTFEYEKADSFNKETIGDIERGIEQFEREIEDAQGPNGMGKFGAIARFYQDTVQNILKKQGYKPEEVTDEHGNKWFEIALSDSRDLGEFYFQVSGPQDLVQKIKEKDINITKKGDEYEVNGNKINRTVQREVKEFYEGRLGSNIADIFFKDFRRETQSKMQVDIKDILSRRVDDDGKIRATPLEQTNPSAVDPNDNSFYQTLDAHIEQRLSSYEPGTTFLNAPNLYDGRTAGTPDLIAITPTGQVDILQFKSVETSRSGDVKVYVQQAYNTEIEAFRRLLERGYGVNKKNFRMTRAIPIKADYEPIIPGAKEKKLSKFTVGSTNVALIKDESLIPIASTSESTGDKKFDSYISRLRGLIQTQASERVSPEKRLEKAQRIASLVAAVKKLQIRKDASGVLSSAKAVIKAQKEKYKTLQTKFSNTDPNVATIAELNKISDDILDDKDQVQIYSDMYQVFKTIFDDGTVESQDIIKEAREISDDARDIADNYLDLAIQFRTKKIAAKLTINDEFNPEKKMTWYRRTIRSLSQSTLKAGAELWKLVERINNKFDLQFKDRLLELSDIQKRVTEWLKGRDVKELYNKIFQFDEKGRWNGRVIQRYSKQFYTDLNKALETRDMKWIRDNIDIDAYNVWMKAEHQKLIDNAKIARVHENDMENARLVQQSLQDFADTFNINFPKGIGTKNDKLKNFPLPKWNSDAYKELEKEENEPVLDLYKYWEKRLKESWESGMFHEYVGKDWFPNVRRGLLEKLTTAKAGGKAATFFSGIRIEAEDQVFGKINPLTGKPIDEVHALYIRDLYQYKEELDGSYFKDYSEKSMDIFKVIGIWDAEILKYQLRTESEAIARLLHYTETNKGILPTTATGKLLRSKETGEALEPIQDDTNAKYLKEHMDAIYYGKKRSNEFDIAFNIPYKAAVQKINKLFGREILTVPEEDEIRVSGTKAIEAMNRYFVTKTLGLNLRTSLAQLFGGTINVMINQGRYFNKKDIAEAEAQYVSNRFWSSDEDKKLAGLIGLIYPFLENRTSQDLRKLSLSGWVKHLSSDHLFFLQRGSDNWVNTIVGISMIKNTMVHEGKLVNMREFARRELGHADKFTGTYEESKAFEDRLEARVEELKKSPQSLINYTKIVGDQIVVEDIERSSDTMVQLRQSILEIIKDALGNVSSEDLSLYKRSIVGQSFFMFKNWIPRMADVRFQSLKFQPGTNKYEYGRVRMLWNAVLSKNRSSIGGLLKLLTLNNSESVIEVAKKEYERKTADFNKELDELEMTEAEFVDMYIKGVRSEMKELIFAVSLVSLLIAARAAEPDDDPEVKGAYRWALRGLDKLTDELTFMYSPASFTSILNGSVFPAVGILVEAQRFFQDVILKLYYEVIGDDEAADRKKVSKHLFRMLPITKELVTYIAIFNNEMAKEYGVKINTDYGSIR